MRKNIKIIVLFLILISFFLSFSHSFSAQATGPDLNNDGIVNVLDISIVSSRIGLTSSDPNYSAIADVDHDGDIDYDDLNYVASHFGEKYSVVHRVIEFPNVNPDGIFINKPTLVTITVQLGADPELIPTEVYLLRVDDQGNVIANLGRLYDDGTHGDELPGDGTFTTQYKFFEDTTGKILLKISANYSAPPTRGYSEVFTIDVVSLPSEEIIKEILTTNEEAIEKFENLVQQFSLEETKQMVVDFLNSKPNVIEASLSPDRNTINILYNSGLEAALLIAPEDTDGTPRSNLGVVASPLYSDRGLPTNRECNYINNKLNNETCIKSVILNDTNVTLESVKKIGDKGVIFIHSHGGMLGLFGNVVGIMTGEEVSTILGIPTSHIIDWILGRVEPVTGLGERKSYWAFKPSFITHYIRFLPNSLVVISACDSLRNDTMADAFLSRGAAAYVGWSNTVHRGFAININKTLFNRLVDGKTLKQAFDEWTLTERTDNVTNAIYKFKGDGNIKLPKELITNGNFETANLSGWTTGFTQDSDLLRYASPGGYWTVISERKVEGNYSARLGRFDQAYTQGLHGPPQPGDEPSGIDWMYQDVEIPEGTQETLKFYYKIRTYDTAVWDWFVMQIRDPNTNAILATVVNKAGKPGTQYGKYWENDWQAVNYDLASFAGRKIRLWFGCRQDGWGDQTAVYIDKVSISYTN